MYSLEDRIKEFVRGQGVEVVGVAGPDRLDGPPSLDPTYTMRGAKSIVSMALPMRVDAIYAFLSKESPTPHNLDQVLGNQRMHLASRNVVDYIRALGYRAEVVPPNNTYRRSLDTFSTRPSFSHRFGAVASGVAAQGWSGNVMIEGYGAAVYLGTVVTDALLDSDPAIPPRHFIDRYCAGCKLCAKTCVAGMFEGECEEYVLLNGELHPRGRRRGLDLCNASCFGLHALNPDREWTTWGKYWIRSWVGKHPETNRLKLRMALLTRGATTGDSTPRYDLIRRVGSMYWPEETRDMLPPVEDLPEDQLEANRLLKEHAARLGVTGLERLIDPNVLTCGQCALVCGPSVSETRERYRALIEGGLVVPGEAPEEMVKAFTYEEAAAIRRKYPRRAGTFEMLKDSLQSTRLWHRYYFGIEPRSIVQGFLYHRKLKKAVGESPR
jgi:ferredoxin